MDRQITAGINKYYEQQKDTPNIDAALKNQLPIHFFTIVLNGEPFIRYHIEVLEQLKFKWHWHIIEGVAELKHDTAWSLRTGGLITNEIHNQGLSNDGTTEYLDILAKQYPQNITIYRQPKGVFWDGKREMVNAPLVNIQEECLLWQVDVDELWTVTQICDARQMFIEHPQKTAAFYWCWYFVGENLAISTRNCYTQNPQYEWLRTWRFKPGLVWSAHEPPTLVENLPNNQQINIAQINPFLHGETEDRGLIFQHYAYVNLEQVQFKEKYYGYANAVLEWKTLQAQTQFPVLLKDYFSWVQDETMVDTAESCGVIPIARKQTTDSQKSSASWQFIQLEDIETSYKINTPYPKIVVDGVFFQFFIDSGIARVWRLLLAEWVKSGFAQHIIVLDRSGKAPKIPGIRYHLTRSYDYNRSGTDSEMLQRVCDRLGADLFISTYYTTPTSTPSVFMAHDMIPEIMNVDLNTPIWQEKRFSILHASTYISVSHNTARDLVKFFPRISSDLISVAHSGVSPEFSPATSEEISQFKSKYKIEKPYFLVVGGRFGCNGYKNIIAFFRAFSKLPDNRKLAIVCVGGLPKLEPELANLVKGATTYVLPLTDVELKCAYSAAIALVYPSLYEGFGLPILEAMACGCPVITCHNSSIPEVAGRAAIYVSESDTNELVSALIKVQNHHVRQSLIADGFKQIEQFSWAKMAETIAEVLLKTANKINSESRFHLPLVWQEFRRLQSQLQQEENFRLKNELQAANVTIAAMQTSKFWKLRNAWFKFKKAIGLPGDD